ncbi:MAG: MarC family protein [Candidatus Micrarchaeota archaeon]
MIGFAKAFLSMFVIMDPLASVPMFLALTKRASAKQRTKAAGEAAIVAGISIVLFILIGTTMLEVMGIGFNSFKIAGGIILLIVGVYTVLGIQFTENNNDLDVAVVLIAVPMITGPGAMSMAIILSEKYGMFVTILASLCAVFVTWGFLRFSNRIHRVLGDRGLEIYSRLLGLFVAAIAIEFISSGIFDMVIQ